MKPSRHPARSGPLLKQLLAATRPRLPESKPQVFQESRPASWHCEIESLQLSILDTWLIMDASLVGLLAARSGHHHVNRRGERDCHLIVRPPARGLVAPNSNFKASSTWGLESSANGASQRRPFTASWASGHWSQRSHHWASMIGVCHVMPWTVLGCWLFLLENMDSIPSSIECTCSFLRPPLPSPTTHAHILAATMFRPYQIQSAAEFPAPGLANPAGGPDLPFDFHRPPNFVAPPTCEHGTPRFSNFSSTDISPSRCCTPSPASISNSLSGSNYSYSHGSTFSPFGSQTSLCTAPSITSACNGQPSPDPSHRDSRAQSPVKPFRSPPSRAGFRAQTPFHRLSTPVSRLQSPVHRIQSPVLGHQLGHRSQSPAIGARGHAPRQPPARAREVNSSIDHSLQRPLRRQSKPGEQPESLDFVMGEADGSPHTHLAFGEQRAQGHPGFDPGDRCSQDPGNREHGHHATQHAQEPARHPFQDRQ